MTDPLRWSRVDALLDAALGRVAEERTRFLDEACQGDRALRQRLDELLELADTDDPELRPGGGLTGLLAQEVLDDLSDGGEATLATGTRLGRFEVRGFLGQGGVGRVYRMHDPTLGREVAVKALARAFHGDAEASRRFEREARALASVSHPNVAVIHGLEVIEGAPYLVLELVEGETLAERVARGRLPWPEAVEIAQQIAQGVEEAHRRGVVHRDLKPANVKLTGGGRVKVLDFGLAHKLPAAADGGSLGDVSITATLPGVVVGTAPYMSPEQARGLAVDARTDVWALGCVLYEILSGRRAFTGATVTDVLAAVVREDPDWTALPSDIPPALRRLVERCLRRDLHKRLQSVGDARLELEELREGAAHGSVPAPRSRTARLVLTVLPWLGLAALAAFVALRVRTVREPGAVRAIQLAVPLPAGIELADDFATPFALSPDASTLVVLGEGDGGAKRLFVRPLHSVEARPLPGSEGAWQPFLSPDGRWVAFFADGRIKKMDLVGGAPVPLAALGSRPRGASWGSDGTIVVAPSESSGLWRVSAEGGRLQELTRPDRTRRERSHRWPQVLPDGSAILFSVAYEDDALDEGAVEALSLRSGARHRLLSGSAMARFLPDGHLVFVRAGRLLAVSFDPQRLEVQGEPVAVLDGVHWDPRSGGAHLAVAQDGTLAYVAGLPTSAQRQLAWIDFAGRRTLVAGPERRYREARLDPQGERIALRIGAADEAEVWIVDTRNTTMSQLTFGLHASHPIWTPDGQRITVAAEGGGRWRLLSVPVGGGDAAVLQEAPHRLQPGDWSADGRFLFYQELRPGVGWDVSALEVDAAGRAAGTPVPLAATPANETRPRLSPDGRWLAYQSDELDGLVRVYVAPFRRGGQRIAISRPAGRWPVWTGARELIYWEPFPSRLRHITGKEADGTFGVVTDEEIWPSQPRDGPRMPAPPFDFDPRSRRVMFLQPSRPDASPAPYRMTLFVGFREEVRRRLAAAPPASPAQ